ncbi:MAG: hypothetical protein RSF90_03200, partial [Pygmaiobacter sp.]
EQVSLTISEVKEDSFSFSMEAKSIVFSGKTARTGNSATYNGKDGTLSFILNNGEITVQEIVAPKLNVSFAGIYQPW